MIIFEENKDSSISVDREADRAIYLAVRDLQRNLRCISGRSDGFEIVYHNSGGGIYVRTEKSGKDEAYTVSVNDECVIITGSDILGTVFGIYAFATRCLNISPVYRLTDLFPEKKHRLVIEKQSFSSKDRPVRFRGWFLNDEDLLSDFRISGGQRHIDYRFYQNVMDTEVLDMVLETALRLEINLVIPSSFVDIDNPDEEKLVEAVCRRGMYISQHHVEPMGVSYFAADNYMKRNGYENEAVSFITNRDRMIGIWRYYAEKWSEYGDHVIWQLGLRGKADQAVWMSDKSISSSMEDRGAIISDAIRCQYDMICEALGKEDFYSTATLWNEGSELYGKGYLKLPRTTIPVFSDFGLDQMFGEDFYTTRRETDRKYGIYYHAGFWSLGPHLTEGCNPEKMAYCYREAAEKNNLYYSILNISNVRPLHISAIMNARIMSSPMNFSVSDELLKLDREMFGDAAETVNEIRREYYSAFADFGDEPLKRTAAAWNFYYREYGELPFVRNAATDGQLAYFGRYLYNGKNYEKLPEQNGATLSELKRSAEKFSRLYKKAEMAEGCVPQNTLLYFKQFVKYQIKHMQLLTEWCINGMGLMDGRLPVEDRLAQGYAACTCLEEILEERKILELGDWENWHRGEKKHDIIGFLKLTKDATERIRNER